MELQEGSLEDKLLTEKLFSGRKDMPKVLDILLQASASVHYLHEKRVIHRDIATRNFLVDKNMKVLICDFGMSRTVAADLKAKTIAGTPNYIAPEILQ